MVNLFSRRKIAIKRRFGEGTIYLYTGCKDLCRSKAK